MKKLLYLSFCLLSMPVFGQLRKLNFDRLSTENGLSENSATCSLQDKQGYIWFGTMNGLVRYDGYKVKVYKLETADKKDRPFSSIRSIMEDKKGRLWIAAHLVGLFRYNPSTDNFTQFKHVPSEVKKSDKESIYKPFEDKEGAIWTFCVQDDRKSYHLDRINPQTGKFTTYDSVSSGSNHIGSSIFYDAKKDASGNIWVAGNRGLYVFDYASKKFSSYLTDTVNKTGFTNLYEAPSEPGILWFSTFGKNGYALVRLDTKKKASKTYRHSVSDPGSLSNDTVKTIYEDRAGHLWIGTAMGLALFNRETGGFTTYLSPDSLLGNNANTCWDIKEGRNGNLWILTGNNSTGKGLLYLPSPTQKLVRYTYDEDQPKGLPSNNLYLSLVDRNGVLWVGVLGKGFYRLDENASQFETTQRTEHADGYPGGALISMAKQDSDHYIITTRKGWFVYQPSANRYSPLLLGKDNKSSKESAMMIIDKQGIAWLGTRSEGLFRYDTKTKSLTNFKNIPDDSLSLSDNSIRTLYEGRDGTLWVGTNGGGLCWPDKKTGKFHRYPYADNQSKNPNGVLDDRVAITIMEDRNGILWVGTSGGGLNKLDKKTGRFISYCNYDKGFMTIIALCEDSKGRMWVGTYLSGLFLFDRNTGKFRNFKEKDGLLSNEVRFINEDMSGKLWLGSGKGLSILDPENFSFTTLTTINGLPQSDIISRGVFEINGDWIVGAENGFISFRPDQFLKNSTVPQIVIQAVSANKNGGNADTTILLGGQDKIAFAYNENRLRFQFAGLHYSNPSLNQYQYKLEGYDKDWVQGGTQRTTTYTNLSPGHYRFMVKVASSDGVWSKAPATVEITIHPPWWQTWWAYTLYVLAFALAIWSYIAYRSKTLRKENKLLEEKVSDRTAQLQKSFEDLKATQQQLVQSEKMASLGELTAGIAHEIQNPLNFINNFSEVSSELIGELKEEILAGNTLDVNAIANNLDQNLQKIVHHGKRADSIVKNMLQHSRQTNSQKEPTDINALADEYLRLSYHGLRAKDKSFNALMKTQFDPAIGHVQMSSQDVGRVLLNLFNNAFYSVMEKKKMLNGDFHPTIYVTTQKLEQGVEIRVRDNGTGIPQKVLDKIYQPFFTTKPTGEGTGLGLSLSYDIITKGHGGALKVDSTEGEGALFIITLP